MTTRASRSSVAFGLLAVMLLASCDPREWARRRGAGGFGGGGGGGMAGSQRRTNRSSQPEVPQLPPLWNSQDVAFWRSQTAEAMTFGDEAVASARPPEPPPWVPIPKRFDLVDWPDGEFFFALLPLPRSGAVAAGLFAKPGPGAPIPGPLPSEDDPTIPTLLTRSPTVPVPSVTPRNPSTTPPQSIPEPGGLVFIATGLLVLVVSRRFR
jgi:hypothetical protein